MAEELVNIGWAGGWDEYVIETDVTRLETNEEIEANQARIARGWGGDPVIGAPHSGGQWLRVQYLNEKMASSFDNPAVTLVKIVRHVRGGD